jgi:hypothetical protein
MEGGFLEKDGVSEEGKGKVWELRDVLGEVEEDEML